LAYPDSWLQRLGGERTHEHFLLPYTAQQHLQRDALEHVIPAAAHAFLHVVSDAAEYAQALAVVFNALQQRQLQRKHYQVVQVRSVAQRFRLLGSLWDEGLGHAVMARKRAAVTCIADMIFCFFLNHSSACWLAALPGEGGS